MQKLKILKIFYWVCFIMALGAFYVGLRSEAYEVQYTLLALGLWGTSYWMNTMIKKENKSDMTD
ncbi:hypothetical protein [Reichenbachiella versicolor]|uniref:hypothetical protein n=1 Tax=Reichenbachiella versicolor TaxID=1821036 RepID=UPI000D6DE00C|nr:hypothetical protein [Reichenbachiella versicolor]